jgi:hypothetical protein
MAGLRPLTSETARALAATIKARKEFERLNPPAKQENLIPFDDETRKKATLRQLDRLDGLIDKALAGGDREAFLELADAKQKLWKLVQPTAGVNKPGRSRRPEPPMPSPKPQEPPAGQSQPQP